MSFSQSEWMDMIGSDAEGSLSHKRYNDISSDLFIQMSAVTMAAAAAE